MALATTTLVPILYDISKELENQQKLNGSVIYYNDPDKHVSNTAHLLRMGDKLLKYNEAKRVLEEEEGQQQMMLKFYTAIALILIILLFVPAIGYMGFELIRKFQKFDCFELVLANKGFLILFFIVLFIYCMMALVNLYQRNEKIYKMMYNTDTVEANNDMISKVSKMFVKTSGDFSSSDDKNITLTSNSPLLMFNFAQAYKKFNITFKPALDGNEKIDSACSRLGKINENDFLSKCLPRSHNGCMYPFIPSQPVNPIVLQKQIQKMDLYGQISKINTGMNWFKAFLLKSTDAVYGKTLNSKMSDAEKRAILDKIVDALTKQFALVKDLYIDESKAQVSNMSEADCYNTFMSDPDCIAATYNAAQRKCILVKKGTVGALRFDKTGSNSVLLRTSNPSTDVLVVTGDTLNQKTVKKSFKSDAQTDQTGQTDQTANQAGCNLTTPGCLMPNSTNTWLGNQKTGDPVFYSDVFSGDSVAFDVNYVVKMSDVVRNNIASLDTLFLTRKDQLSKMLVDTILTVDPTNTFALSQNDINYITKQVDKVNRMASIVVGDILMEVPTKLQTSYDDISENKRKESSGLNKYIPHARFVEKLNELSSSKFVLEFVNSAEDLRSCSTGVKDLYDNYDYTGFLQKEQAKLSDTSLIFYLTTGLLGWTWYVTQDYLYSNDETDADYCVLRPEPVKEDSDSDSDDDSFDPPILPERIDQTSKQTSKPTWPKMTDVMKSENAKILGVESKDEKQTDEPTKSESEKEEKDGMVSKEGEKDKDKNEPGFFKKLADKTSSLIDEAKMKSSSLIDKTKETTRGIINKVSSADTLVKKYFEAGEEKKRLQNDKENLEKELQKLNESKADPRSVLGEKNKKTIEKLTTDIGELDKRLKDISKSIDEYTIEMQKRTDVKKGGGKEDGTETETETETEGADTEEESESSSKKKSKDKNANANVTNAYSNTTLPSKEKKKDDWDTRTNKGIKYLLILVFIIISFLVFRSIHKKDKQIKDYNRMMIETNGTIIVNNGRNLMQIIYDDLSKDRYNISSSNNKINLAPFIKKGVIINTRNQKTFKTQGVTEDEYFDVIAQHTVVSDSVKVKLNDSAKTEEVYNLLVQTLEAYEKCNTIASSQTPTMPLPIFQIVTYSIIIAITLGVIFFIMSELKPVQNFKDTMKLRAIIDRAETKHQIVKSDLDMFVDVNDPENIYGMTFVKIIGASLIVMFAILFAVQIEQNTSQFTLALYGGELFRNNQCYES